MTASISEGDAEAILARNVLGDPGIATENSQGEIDVESVILAPLRDRDGKHRGMIHLTTESGSQPLQTRDLEYVVAVGEILTASLVNLADRKKLARSLKKTKQQVKDLQRRLGDKVRILGNSQPMQDLVEKIGLAAPTPATILIRGESESVRSLSLLRYITQANAARRSSDLLELCGSVSDPVGERALRARERCFHGGNGAESREVRVG